MKEEKFKLGELTFTRSLYEIYTVNDEFAIFIDSIIERHLSCDWSDMDEEDVNLNIEAIENNSDRIFGSFNIPEELQKDAVSEYGQNEQCIWIITEWDRSVTTVLFPSEY